MEKVYALVRVDWHISEGEFNELIDIYKHKEDADAARLNYDHMYSHSDPMTSVYYVIHEKELK